MAPLETFAAGTVIPAMPLALTEELSFDERRQRALVRYYLAAGAGGLAAAVHSTQFAIHTTHAALLRPVLELVADTARKEGSPDLVLVAGVVGETDQAVAEAELAASLGYDAVLLAPYGVGDRSEDALLDRARKVGDVLPVIGFALQPAVGGRRHSRGYWTRLADIPSVLGVKAAPFDRYATLDIVSGLAASSRRDAVTLYTGNDDHIVGDLVASFAHADGSRTRFAGGLLGQWSVWTRGAVETLELARLARDGDQAARLALDGIDGPLTDANGAIFDAAGGFAGCVPGIHEVLRRQGLLAGTWCLDPHERLSPGQLDEIDRIWAAHPQLRDDDFVAAHLDEWLA
ncbi:dihydrodipicolinate synthase family protein [Jiangella alba]|uniref:Dihydrodipicolinate synthase/N-acetylneuraminate lyase n=1 Tax=Jiangella alba TaxID=561176 RepID=A0A1H5PYU3_9ACTN|nr:dihydrodipicolinate synthase family protein [Jiangella alba]SEF18824.1 Dihydrodipicolinate synthase/N-acetylneuraminate lyase [Jiangella alba]